MKNKLSSQEMEMVDDVYAATLTAAPLRYRFVIWGVFAFFIALISWASMASLDEVARGDGKVIPPSQVQIIQSLDGGVLDAMYVKEGQHVQQGDALAHIEDIRFRADVAQQDEEEASLSANILRMQHELASILVRPAEKEWKNRVEITIKPITFPEKLSVTYPELVSDQQEEYQGRLLDLQNRLAIFEQQIRQKQQEQREALAKSRSLYQSYKLIKRELSITIPLARKGIVSEVEQLKIERQVNEIKGELESLRLLQPKLTASVDEAILLRREAVLSFNNETRSKLNEYQVKLSKLNQAQVSSRDKVAKTTIVSPVTGTIKTIHVNTIGGVVQPGMEMIEIVPDEENLLIEAKIAPKDIAFLYPGLPSVVKVSAYDFTRYGGLQGTLEHISADTSQDDKGNSYYLVRIRTDKSYLNDKQGASLPIIPGMMTSVDIITGKRTVLEYLVNPILRAKESALRER